MSVHALSTKSVVDQRNGHISHAFEQKAKAELLAVRAREANNFNSVIAASASVYRAEKAISSFTEALEFGRHTQRAHDYSQTGSYHMRMCERQLVHAVKLLEERQRNSL